MEIVLDLIWGMGGVGVEGEGGGVQAHSGSEGSTSFSSLFCCCCRSVDRDPSGPDE